MRPTLFALLVALPLTLFGQAADVAYKMPPKEIADVVEAPPTPLASVSPDGSWLLLIQQPPFLTIADLSEPELKLAGLRFDPDTHDQARLMYATSLTLVRVASGEQRTIGGLPASPRMRFATWSPDSQHIAFTMSTPQGVDLWVADVANATARQIRTPHLNQLMRHAPFEWMPDSHSLVVRAVPPNRPPVAAIDRTPRGPAVQESRGRKAAARTYEDMLHDESDAALFEYHMQAIPMIVSIDGGDAQGFPYRPAMLVRMSPSPDGRYFVAETVHRPFSYTVPVERFPRKIEVWTTKGPVRLIAELGLADQVPIDFDAVRTGPRDVEWRSDQPATLFWAQALDKGDPKNDVPARDRLYTFSAPFTADPQTLMDTPLRFDNVEWGSGNVALVETRRFKDRKTQMWRLQPNASAPPEIVFDRSYEDRYGDPGNPVTTVNAQGKPQLLLDKTGHAIYLIGEGASPEGARPFIDRLDLNTKKTTRLFRSEAPYYEMPVTLANGRLITRRESPTDPPNWFVRDLGGRKKARAITSIANPTPQLANVKKEVIHYKRADGLELNGTLYLPPGYDAAKDGPLPALLWAYPLEYKSAAAASQVTTSPYRFIRVAGMGSPIFFVLRGYAVLDNPTIPIVGEGNREPNDTYVDQLVAGAKAAVDELVRRGVGDRNRMAIAGHSYGAFMTANLLAHSDLFRAGIARSGAYNRTLTPFSFQSEERSYWQARDIYTTMSPFTFADKIRAPLLLIHGEEDDNTGTFPIQSERLYQAISGLGGTVRLVMLPKEAHGYRARESVMHTLWEMDQWLEKYVKNR